MPDTYTSPWGTTQKGTSLQGFQDSLNQITGVAPNDKLGQAASYYGGQAMQREQGLPQYQAQAYNQLTQQSGIPQLTQQYGDLGKAFQMYLADQGFAQKYAAPASTPLTASPDTTGGVGGFQGFTNPSITTEAMGVPGNTANSFLNQIVSAINMANTGVQNQMTSSIEAYKSGISILKSIVDSINEERKIKASSGGGSGVANERERNLALLMEDIKNANNYKDLLVRYQGLGISDPEIRDLYNRYSPLVQTYGPAKETALEEQQLKLKPSSAISGPDFAKQLAT